MGGYWHCSVLKQYLATGFTILLAFASAGKECVCNAETQGTQVQSLGREGLLEEEMATHSSILAWRIPWLEEPGGLQSMGHKSQT